LFSSSAAKADRLFSTFVGEEEESGRASALATMTAPSPAEEVEGGMLASLAVLTWVTMLLLGDTEVV